MQIVTNVNGKPLDRPGVRAVLRQDERRSSKPVWVHPTRTAKTPDYATEEKSLYEIWWTFGWSYDTAAFMARMVFSKTLDKYPDLKIIVHHFGGIVPMLEGRIGPGWDQLGARTSDEDYGALLKSLKKRPLDYFKQDFYADTAVFTSDAATELGMKFYPLEKIVFASDCPFDPEKGTMYIRETIRIIDALDADQGAARPGVLQEPGADHGEEVREVAFSRHPEGPARSASLEGCQCTALALRGSPHRGSHLRRRLTRRVPCVCSRPSPLPPRHPRPRAARRPGAARRQGHHRRQGLARRAGGRGARTGASSRSATMRRSRATSGRTRR